MFIKIRVVKILKHLKTKVVDNHILSKLFKKVETTIWGFTDKNVILKKTIVIPIRCVHEVKFY